MQHVMPPYGTPPHPYVAMYPHGGIYAHPAMPPVVFVGCLLFVPFESYPYCLAALNCRHYVSNLNRDLILSVLLLCLPPMALQRLLWVTWTPVSLSFLLITNWIIFSITCKFPCRAIHQAAWKQMASCLRGRKNYPSRDLREVWAVWIWSQAKIMNPVNPQEHPQMESLPRGKIYMSG